MLLCMQMAVVQWGTYMLPRNLYSIGIVVLCSLFSMADNSRPVRNDSVMVSAGVLKPQLAMGDQLNTTLSEADRSLKAGKADEAVQQYEDALATVRREPLLADQELRVLTKLANGYIQANRPADAIPIFSKLLETSKEDCAPESETLSTCGDAEEALAFAKIQAGDFTGALTDLHRAAANYAKAETRGDGHEFAMIEIMKQAETKVLSAIALYRLGKASDASATIAAALPELTRVEEDKSISAGIRDSAASSIEEAQSLLRSFKAGE